MTIFTTRCKQRDHSEFMLNYDESKVIEPDIQWLKSYLEDEVAKGTIYRPKETLQVGWIVLRIGSTDGNLLTLWEPNMKGLPTGWECSVSNTLLQLRVQKTVLEMEGVNEDDILIPSMLQSGFICTEFNSDSNFHMERLDAIDVNDSGWFFGCLDESHDHNESLNLSRKSLYEIVCNATVVIPYLLLPMGYSVRQTEEYRRPVVQKPIGHE